MKKWIEVSPYSGIEEDAPANNAGSGEVSMPPDAVNKKKKKHPLINRSMMDARTKVYKQHRERLETQRAKREALRNMESKFIGKVKEDIASETTQDVNEKSGATKFECLECGNKFKKKISSKTVDVKCPKCGGYDVEVDE